MEDLELLKQHWNKPATDLKSYTEKDLFKMIKGKSFSIARILLIIGLLEITFWVLFNFYDTDKNESFFSIEYILRTLLFVVFMGLLLYSYINIKNETNAKNLMKQILNLRKVILAYIFITFFIIILFGIINIDKNANDAFRGWVAGQDSFDKDYPLSKSTSDPISPQVGYIFYFIFSAVILIILYFLYKKVYGNLLKKLKLNYNELSKAEQNTN